MFTPTNRLNNASAALLDAELKLKSLRYQITQVEREIATLNAIEYNLVDNLRFLKKKRIIVVAISEYRKAKESLLALRVRRTFLKGDLEHMNGLLKNAEKEMELVKLEHERAFKALHHGYDNVVEVNFRKKDENT